MGNRSDLVASFRKDWRERGHESGGVESARGLGKEVSVPAEEQVAKAEVGSVAQPGDGGADLLLGLLGDAVLVRQAVDDQRDDGPGDSSRPSHVVDSGSL
jgi:hypothetical protein